jgi:uncharacterized membrane protein YphA (DoxX/SURF4 family)
LIVAGIQRAKEKEVLDQHLEKARQALRLTYGVVPIVAGLDKFTNLLTEWTQYLSPLAERILPVSPQTFMYAVGIIEIAAGVLVLTRHVRIGAYVVSVWLAAIALNLLSMGHYFDVAVRDLVMSVGAFTLAKLSEVRVAAAQTQRKTAPQADALVPTQRLI